jgi:ribosomal protein L22
MNEMGLSREVVREMVEKIVTETVDKHMSSLVNSGRLDRIVEDAFQRKYRDPKNGYADFKGLVASAAADAAKKFVAESLVISPNAGIERPMKPQKGG